MYLQINEFSEMSNRLFDFNTHNSDKILYPLKIHEEINLPLSLLMSIASKSV